MNSFLQAFLLLDESQRDHRLSSISDKQILSNGNQITSNANNEEKNIDQLLTQRYPKVECNLQKAEWEQVKIISFSFHILSILLFI
jgi:hypothetical protein